MSSFQGDELFQSQDQIAASMIAALQAVVPDAFVDEDSVLRMIAEIEAGQIEGLYIANQLALQDMFPQTASITGLQRFGETYGIAQNVGTVASGLLLFAGQGGTYINTGAEVAFDPGGGADLLYFVNTVDGTIPSPGVASPPSAAIDGVGTLTGTYEWAVSFLTVEGETLPSSPSNALVLSSNKAQLSSIPLGGPGTIARNIYRSMNNGPFLLVEAINDNTTLSYVDNGTASGQEPLDTSTAEQILLQGQAENTGSDYNAVPGAITITSNVPEGVVSVNNPFAFGGGIDPETTDAFRSRVLNWIRGPQTGSPTDLANWALTVPGVSTATVFSNMNGTTPTAGYSTIRIGGPNGTIPNSDVIATTLALLQSKTLQNITIVVTTFTPEVQNLTIKVTLADGYTLTGVTEGVQIAASNYINNLGAGETMYLAGVEYVVFPLQGIVDVSVTSPDGNVTASATQQLVAGTITVTL